MLVPAISNTVVSFVNKIPVYTSVVEEGYNDTVDFFAEYNIELPPWTDDVVEDKETTDTNATKDVVSTPSESAIMMSASTQRKSFKAFLIKPVIP